jgi:hypothetical protein
MKISISSSAFNDLENIIDYYAKEGVPQIGLQFAQEIIDHAQVPSDYRSRQNCS